MSATITHHPVFDALEFQRKKKDERLRDLEAEVAALQAEVKKIVGLQDDYKHYVKVYNILDHLWTFEKFEDEGRTAYVKEQNHCIHCCVSLIAERISPNSGDPEDYPGAARLMRESAAFRGIEKIVWRLSGSRRSYKLIDLTAQVSMNKVDGKWVKRFDESLDHGNWRPLIPGLTEYIFE